LPRQDFKLTKQENRKSLRTFQQFHYDYSLCVQ